MFRLLLHVAGHCQGGPVNASYEHCTNNQPFITRFLDAACSTGTAGQHRCMKLTY